MCQFCQQFQVVHVTDGKLGYRTESVCEQGKTKVMYLTLIGSLHYLIPSFMLLHEEIFVNRQIFFHGLIEQL